jgi:hypothetical protein
MHTPILLTFVTGRNTMMIKIKKACGEHRNLRSRTSMLVQVLQIFLGKEHLIKNQLISTLDKVIYFKGTIFPWSTKPLFTSQNRMETS